MTERPILFSAPMVRAILDGRKTQTRRVAKLPQEPKAYLGTNGQGDHVFTATERWGGQVRCPYGVPGDVLWVRETWHYINHQNGPGGLEVCVGYPADGENLPNRPSHIVTDPERWADKIDAWPYRTRRRPGIHMPRWASRISLRITDVQVERLNEISEADALAEGIRRWPDGRFSEHDAPLSASELAATSPAGAYRVLWEEINGRGSWGANPWVWAVSFERIV